MIFKTSERLKPDRLNGSEVALEEVLDAPSLLKAALLYAGDVSSSFSKGGSGVCMGSLA